MSHLRRWLDRGDGEHAQVDGVIFLHPITSPLTTSPLINFTKQYERFKRFQERYVPRNMLLVTTKWDDVDNMVTAQAREKDILDANGFRKWARSKGADYRRHNNTRESAMHILGDVVYGLSMNARRPNDVSETPRSEAQRSTSNPSNIAAKQEDVESSEVNVNEADDESMNLAESSEVSHPNGTSEFLRLIS